jgi:Family of unknown function (DUF6412)
MRGVWVRAATLVVLGSLLLATAEPSLVLGVVAALLVVWALAHSRLGLPAEAGPAASARERRRALARRAVPRQRDPDAPGRTRSRAPSGPVPAV